jgi:hypothetical protein
MSEMGTEIVTLCVGPEKYVFRVHKKPLCKKILYFAKMFGGGFEEATTSTATFPEDESVTFGRLLNWVYHGTVPAVILHKDEEGKWKENWDVLKLYTLAEKLCISEVMDRALEALMSGQRYSNVLPGIEDIDAGYSSTGENSSMRKFLCQTFIYALTSFNTGRPGGAWENAGMQMLLVKHPDLAKDIVPILRGTMGQKVGNPLHPLKASKCAFHSHGENEPCFLGGSS